MLLGLKADLVKGWIRREGTVNAFLDCDGFHGQARFAAKAGMERGWHLLGDAEVLPDARDLQRRRLACPGGEV
jgi:hypothetical protein